MNTFVLKNTAAESIATEVMFNVASERVQKSELLKFAVDAELPEEKKQKVLAVAIRILRGMKKQGRIQLFATPEDFEGQTTVASYLSNKYPDAQFFAETEDFCIIVRI